MKHMQVDVLLYAPEKPVDVVVEMCLPMEDGVAAKLLRAQDGSQTTRAQKALYELAAAVGDLNGLRGIPLRVTEVSE